ncbi:MAG TPA: MurT ligase domain-containing protein [Dehalococcoidia bacterium]|nr:MurT ligase domain-containing protein [Dehalococcoidia bacterium]
MAGPRTIAAVFASKAAAIATRAVGRGGGTALPGLIALRLDEGIVYSAASRLGKGCVLITGTNGKTTASRLIAATARESGLDVTANTSGSNLMRGLASTLGPIHFDLGYKQYSANRLGVFEVDEAVVPAALVALRPRVAVFTNLFRDQLDRYGEVEAVAQRWREALAAAPADLRLVLNADDPAVAGLGEGREHVTYFGVDDKRLDRGRVEHAADSLTCACGGRLEYDAVYYGQIGAWRCPTCGRKRPKLDVAASDVDLRDGRSVSFSLRANGQTGPSTGLRTGKRPKGPSVELGIGGLYNVYNALAAIAATSALELPNDAAIGALSSTEAAFGRQEWFEVDGRRVELFLGKNPAGLNQVLQTLLLDPKRRTALFILNDGIADGRDVSWIWDADFDVAASRFETVVTSGRRAAEMALRLKYAGYDEARLTVEPDIAAAIARAVAATPPGECLTIVPTYTAMLEARALLAQRTGRKAFWQ